MPYYSIAYRPTHSRSIYLNGWKKINNVKSNYVFLKFPSILFHIQYHRNFKKKPYEFIELKVFYTNGKINTNILEQTVFSMGHLGHTFEDFSVCLGRIRKNYSSKKEMFDTVIGRFWQTGFSDFNASTMRWWQEESRKNKNFDFLTNNKSYRIPRKLADYVQGTPQLEDL